ncbi:MULTISPECIES: cell division protein ZipA [Idiomarina]|jgi:cell division protein ZipA|uniref:Cell division protein ZipA n=1 Tax=Idiomarina abyssalis TaxID=86102 RepID=A0A8I1G8Z5_9GAMM|nr:MULTISPECIES: cell division protein ZipA [Idiomarina]MAO69273.1 cell division protein ZipA [Idiomarina sp.]MBF80653.1 cell division protein ZipA [Idiomarina sp.]MBJ7266497.1 cell division protein ZipA [Idiomarina abyssalis]MBJ7274448.1 cell division protein ZipA [Idiomarina abyssalis]MBJ7315500.1 cell division protein ZipA [Idiomarina abyssalis]|tara:strand:+ start:5624 stop:6523 length:900 start_codon:yes stop_codon:yes gene_type:complete
MGSLQITLSILGILAIAGIVAHGVWKIRKGNAQQRQREQRVAENRQQQSSAFDDDGIGEVRVVKHKAEEATEAKESVAPELSSSTSEKEDDNEHIEQMSMDLDRDDELSESLPSMRVSNEEQVDVEQTELKFDDNDEHDEEVDQYETLEEDNQKNSEDFEAVPEEVIALHVKGPVQGAVLLQMMTELGCKFGDLGIFHRYENTAGTGPMIFSVANMFNPGTFDLDNMENFETEGVAFFMALPMKFDGQQAFNMMLNAAKKLATEIPQGQVLDGQRQLLTRQSIHEARQRIREFERKHSA